MGWIHQISNQLADNVPILSVQKGQGKPFKKSHSPSHCLLAYLGREIASKGRNAKETAFLPKKSQV